jgi:hypothetical protein
MHGGEPKDHEIFAQNDSFEGFFRILLAPSPFPNGHPTRYRCGV